MTSQQIWQVIDSRTGQPVSVAGYASEASAQAQIERWRSRAARGGRPDCADALPHLVPAPAGAASRV